MTVKRAVDIAIALPLVLITAPLVALLALAVRLESRGRPDLPPDPRGQGRLAV